MALDTRNRRDSAIGLTLPWRNRLPLPDGTLDADDRLHLSWLYSGIAAGLATVPPITDFTLDFDYQRDVTLDYDFARDFEVRM